MTDKHNYMKALKCRECERKYPLEATPRSYGNLTSAPAEIAYDYERIKIIRA